MSHRSRILALYHSMLKENSKFKSFNFREYGNRRIREGFRENRNVSDPQKLSSLLSEAHRNLDIIKRQALINSFYSQYSSVMEHGTLNSEKTSERT